jgi:pyruvate/2-oxoglutarate dehydrogenase complex dihydrolipoamide dehydrogenase (E3) component
METLAVVEVSLAASLRSRPDMGATWRRSTPRKAANLSQAPAIDTTDREVAGVLLADGRRLPADAVVLGIGAAPNIEWLEGSGVNLCDGVLCDSMGRTNVPASRRRRLFSMV